MNRRGFIQSTLAACAAAALPPVLDSGTLTETYERRNHALDHVIGLLYTGTLGRYWVGEGTLLGYREDIEQTKASAMRLRLRAEMEKALSYRRETGSWPLAS